MDKMLSLITQFSAAPLSLVVYFWMEWKAFDQRLFNEPGAFIWGNLATVVVIAGVVVTCRAISKRKSPVFERVA